MYIRAEYIALNILSIQYFGFHLCSTVRSAPRCSGCVRVLRIALAPLLQACSVCKSVLCNAVKGVVYKGVVYEGVLILLLNQSQCSQNTSIQTEARRAGSRLSRLPGPRALAPPL